MELLSYNGGYIGYNASLDVAKPPFDESNPSTITDWTVDQPETKKTNNIHFVGSDTFQNTGGSTTYVTKLGGQFASIGSDDGSGKNYIKKGDVIVCWAYADTYSATIHTSGTAFLPRYWNGSSFTNFTNLGNRLNSADANVQLSYFIATKDSSSLDSTGFVLNGGTSSATGQYNILYNVVSIRGLTADANLNSLAGINSVISNTGATGLPTATGGAIPGAAVEGVEETWVVLTGWAVDDDVPGSSWVQVHYYSDFNLNNYTGSSSSGGTAGISATIHKNSSAAGGTSYTPEVKYYTSTTYGGTTLATDAWILYQVAFKAGVEVQQKILPKNSGIWNLTTNTIERSKSIWYKDQIPKYFSYWQYNYTLLKFARPGNTTFLQDQRITFVYPTYYDLLNTSNNTTFEITVLDLNLQSLAYSYNGAYYVPYRLYLPQPCRIRFRIAVRGNNTNTYGYLAIQKASNLGTIIQTELTYSGTSTSTATYSSYTDYYTCTAPEYLKVLLTFQNVFITGNTGYPYVNVSAEVTLLNV